MLGKLVGSRDPPKAAAAFFFFPGHGPFIYYFYKLEYRASLVAAVKNLPAM